MRLTKLFFLTAAVFGSSSGLFAEDSLKVSYGPPAGGAPALQPTATPQPIPQPPTPQPVLGQQPLPQQTVVQPMVPLGGGNVQLPAQPTATQGHLSDIAPASVNGPTSVTPFTPLQPGPFQVQPMLPAGAAAISASEGQPRGLIVPVGLVPMNRLAGHQVDNPSGLDVAQMIGPMRNPAEFLSRWSTPETVPYHAEEAVSPVRKFNSPELGGLPWAEYTYAWHSPVFYHNPLYFEQPNLERYGIGTYPILQPAVSSAHFFTSIALVPYKTLTQHPCEKYYTLGNLRPGNCNPIQRRVLLGQSTVGEVFEYGKPNSGY